MGYLCLSYIQMNILLVVENSKKSESHDGPRKLPVLLYHDAVPVEINIVLINHGIRHIPMSLTVEYHER